MDEQNKKLLLKDLCTRLPYGVMCQVDDGAAGLNDGKLVEIDVSKELVRFDSDGYWDAYVDDIKPYLRPISSMTTDEEYEYHQIRKRNSDKSLSLMDCSDHLEQLLFSIVIEGESVDWLNRKMFDYHTDDEGKTMIEKGLAIKAPKDMYRKEE